MNRRMTSRLNRVCRKRSKFASQKRRSVFFWPSIASSSETRCESSTDARELAHRVVVLAAAVLEAVEKLAEDDDAVGLKVRVRRDQPRVPGDDHLSHIPQDLRNARFRPFGTTTKTDTMNLCTWR